MAGNRMMIFSGNANRAMANDIVAHLGVPLNKIDIRKFSDGEIFAEVRENVRGADVYIIQPTCDPVNDNIMELAIMADAFRRASARRITAVMPYYGYARQDRKDAPRVPISAKVVAEIYMAVGIRRMLFMDLHSAQIVGFYNIPCDHIFSELVFVPYLKKNLNIDENVIMVSPDAGGVTRTRSFAKELKTGLAIIDKRRDEPNKCEAMNVIGDVKGKTAILMDDMVDTAGTLCEGAETLLDHGAKEVHACCAHPVLSGEAIDRINKSPIKTLMVTNSIPLGDKKDKCDKIVVVSASIIMAEAMIRIHNEDSVSALFVKV
jgi:ribose-phosphate pyrophosphokinase